MILTRLIKVHLQLLQIMWLKETYKGLASGIIYARKGDKVNVIRVEDCLTFVEFNGEKFHVQSSLLSDVKVEADKEFFQSLPAKNQPQTTIRKTTKSISKTQQLF
jgi:hypothetical protein